jgi:molybdenum cofactor cytidylyltransferase
MQTLAIAILAAGASRRLKRPKQLLSLRGKSFVQHAVEIAKETKQTPIFLVVGANSEEVKAAVQAEGVTIVHNDDWQEGMASSIRAAVTQAQGCAQALLFLNCDQPFITADSLNKLIGRFHPIERPLVAAQYNAVTGSPVIFSHIFFDRLLELKGDVGAKSLLRESEGQLTRVEMPDAALDIDTEDDWRMISQTDSL